uniref:Uncharacterized protein n=1 Tax=Strigamia maritima TaxID=126957 RepID=T1JH77_STRMM
MNSCFGPLYSFGRTSSPPLQAAVPKLEVIEDLDLYFIRQIAHSLKEYDLEQKIDLEIKMREGTTKLLAACKHPTQTLEAAKSLLTSNERMTAYMAELQQRKAVERKQAKDMKKIEPCKAKVCVSDIRMPLIWKDSDHFKNKGDYRRFAVFCLLKLGTEIYDTLMVNNVDRSMTDITFEDVVVFDNAKPDFEFRLEVYSHVLHDDLSIASTPRKIKRKINDSISRTVGKKLAANLKDELNSDVGPKFDLVAHAVLNLQEVCDSIKTYDLIMENIENRHSQLPLFGHFCCRLAALPECLVEDRITGYLAVEVGDLSCLRRLWGTVRNFQLSVWAKPSEVNASEPQMIIPINKNTKITPQFSDEHPHSFRIQNTSGGLKHDVSFVVENESEVTNWVLKLTQHCQDQLLWKQAVEKIMEIQSPTPYRLPFAVRQRKGSLYDETSLKGSYY